MLTECLQKWREEKSSTVSLNFLYSIFCTGLLQEIERRVLQKYSSFDTNIRLLERGSFVDNLQSQHL